MYGVPESAFSAVEKQQLDQYFKCIGCALENLDEHPNFLYQVNGTVLCLRHAKEIYAKPGVTNITYDHSNI